jgi:hypothetical protein
VSEAVLPPDRVAGRSPTLLQSSQGARCSMIYEPICYPAPALVGTGHGRTQPNIMMRTASVVHREVVARVPTGFENNQGDEGEDMVPREVTYER